MKVTRTPLEVTGITGDSQSIIELFLESYTAEKTYINAIRRLCELTKKFDFAQLTIEDYFLVKVNFSGNVSKLLITFFKFLYCSDFLENELGFESSGEFYSKEYYVTYFKRKRDKKSNKDNAIQNSEEYISSISLAQLDKLRIFVKNSLEDKTNYNNIRKAYCFHALFFDGISVNALRDIDAKNYDNGTILTADGIFDVPQEYHDMLMHFKNRTMSKFSVFHFYVEDLGKIVGIDNLIPFNITLARKQNLWQCPECGNEYLSFTENWQSINNKLVCVGCAEKLLADDVKKNLILTYIINTDVDLLSEREHKKIEHHTSSFEKLRSKLKPPCDFDSWNDYLKEIGELGEKYVVEQEKIKLVDAGLDDLAEQVSDTPASDHNNGYDVLSYTTDKKELHIEVKATPGYFDQPFYFTQNELKTAERDWKSGKNHEVHRVYNVQNGEVGRVIYKNFENFDFKNLVYKVTLKNRE